VALSVVSTSATKKAESKKTTEGLPDHSFRTLLDDLATLVVNTVQLPSDKASITMATQPTALQSKAFRLLEVRLNESVPIFGPVWKVAEIALNPLLKEGWGKLYSNFICEVQVNIEMNDLLLEVM